MSRWARAIRQRGMAAPLKQGRPLGRGKLAPYQAFIEELVAQDPDITLYELGVALAMAEGVGGLLSLWVVPVTQR
ncbi:MAG: hypothetical protein EA407_14180 [Rhodobacteraceae bacterium]|nr:MAG: hypothetical protein EA407_14180 [Paracoccaceae bacterium]